MDEALRSSLRLHMHIHNDGHIGNICSTSPSLGSRKLAWKRPESEDGGSGVLGFRRSIRLVRATPAVVMRRKKAERFFKIGWGEEYMRRIGSSVYE
jgi:hypothetical protein